MLLNLLLSFFDVKVYLIFQVSGYGEKMATLEKVSALNITGEHGEDGSCQSAFQALAAMLQSLVNKDSDGRMIISRSSSTSSRKQGQGYIKYVMLSAEKIFSEVCVN